MAAAWTTWTDYGGLLRRAAEHFNPPPALSVWQWAEENRVLGKDVTARPGRYRVAAAPYQREPQESFLDRDVQTTVLCWASRLGKTEIVLNLQGRTIDIDPKAILVCYPTLDSAQKWSKKFFEPMRKSTPSIARLIGDARSRDSDNTILSKSYPGGSITAIGANSPSGFRQIQAPVAVCDEIDAMENGIEGDPVTLAFKRTENYPDSTQVVSSTPTIKGASRIFSWLERSDYRKWHVPCPHCGTWQVLAWAQVKFPDGPENAWLECEECKAKLNDSDRLKMIRAGGWKPTREFRGVRGYWLNGLNTTFPPKKGFKSKLHQFAQEFLDANKEGKHALKVWINTFLAETYEEEAEKVDALEIMKRREDYGPELPEGALLLTCGVDVQGDRLELEVVGWGSGEESWGIQYRTLPGNPLLQKVWNDLDDFLCQEEWRHPSGIRLKIAATCIDSGGVPGVSEMVYAFCKPRFARRVFATKGGNTQGLPLVGRLTRNNRARCPLFNLGVDNGKSLVYGRLQIEKPGAGYCHFPSGVRYGYDVDYFQMLTAEEIRTRIVKGFPRREWHKVRKRNEALDIRVLNSAAVTIIQPNWRVLTERIVAQAEKAKDTGENVQTHAAESQQPAPARKPWVKPRRGGWVKRW